MQPINSTTKMLPSGFTVTLREQTGEDEDILSRLGDVESGTSFNNFLSNIIIGSSLEGKTRFTPEDIAQWPTEDKYQAILFSRIFSIGKELTFNHICENKSCNKHKTPLEVDLSIYDWDLSTGNPPEDTPFLNHKPRLHPDGTMSSFDHITSWGMAIRYGRLTGVSELKAHNKKRADISRNDELRSRNLAYKLPNGEYQLITNFRMFNAKQMKELRHVVLGRDSNQDWSTDCECSKCGKTEQIIILSIPDFFFPSGI